MWNRFTKSFPRTWSKSSSGGSLTLPSRPATPVEIAGYNALPASGTATGPQLNATFDVASAQDYWGLTTSITVPGQTMLPNASDTGRIVLGGAIAGVYTAASYIAVRDNTNADLLLIRTDPDNGKVTYTSSATGTVRRIFDGTYISAANEYAIRANIPLTSITLPCVTTLDTASTYTMYVSVWRRTGLAFGTGTLVAERAATGNMVAGQNCVFTLSSPITPQVGDFIGVRLSPAPAALWLMLDTYADSGSPFYIPINYSAYATLTDGVPVFTDRVPVARAQGSFHVKATGQYTPDIVLVGDTLPLGMLPDGAEPTTYYNFWSFNDKSIPPFNINAGHSYNHDNTLCPIYPAANHLGLAWMQNATTFEWAKYANYDDAEPDEVSAYSTYARIPADLIAYTPPMALIFTGWHDLTGVCWLQDTNESAGKVNYEARRAGYQAHTVATIEYAIEECLDNGIVPFILGIPPCACTDAGSALHPAGKYPGYRKYSTYTFNEAIRAKVAEYPEAVFINLETSDFGTLGVTTAGDYTTAGLPCWTAHAAFVNPLSYLHLNRVAYDMMAVYIERSIRTRFGEGSGGSMWGI